MRGFLQRLKRGVFLGNDWLAVASYLLHGRSPKEGLTVLCYHRIVAGLPSRAPFNPYNVDPETFRRQIGILKRSPTTKVTLEDVVGWRTKTPPSRGAYVLLTFDDVWGHTVPAAEQLVAGGLTGVFFVPTAFVGGAVYPFSSFDTWYASRPDADPWCYKPVTVAGCERLLALGMSVQPHGHRHIHLGSAPESEMNDDVAASIRFVEDILGQEVSAFCFPYGSPYLGDLSSECLELLERQGLTLGFTTETGANRLSEIGSNGLKLRRIAVNDYDEGLLFEAKVAGYCGLLPLLKRVWHQAQRP